MRKLSELDDDVLLQEYRHSIKGLMRLDPTLPKGMHDIRVKYRDYLGKELAARGLLSPNTEHGDAHGVASDQIPHTAPIRYLRGEASPDDSPTPPSGPQRGLLTRPTLDQVLEYRQHIDEGVTALLDSADSVALRP